MRDDFIKIQNFSFQQLPYATIGFVWEIHEKWYGSDLWSKGTQLPEVDPSIVASANVANNYHFRMRPYINTLHAKNSDEMNTEDTNGKEDCVYISDDTLSHPVKVLQRQLIERIQSSAPINSIFGGMHLRRGDAVEKCDTEVETIRRYLSCSLKNTDTLNRNITLLMMSDDMNDAYREQILQLANDYSYVSILDVDHLTEAIVRDAIRDGIIDKSLDNNYFHYEVSSAVRKKRRITNFFLQRRRSKCKDCIPLANYLQNE
jgi:hypothetical protein